MTFFGALAEICNLHFTKKTINENPRGHGSKHRAADLDELSVSPVLVLSVPVSCLGIYFPVKLPFIVSFHPSVASFPYGTTRLHRFKTFNKPSFVSYEGCEAAITTLGLKTHLFHSS